MTPFRSMIRKIEGEGSRGTRYHILKKEAGLNKMSQKLS